MKVKTDAPVQEAQDDSALPLVLVVCIGNSCRSQMAEGFLKTAAADFLEVASAGSNPAGFVHPLSIRVMAEAGIDIAQHRSKSLDEFANRRVETVITVCGHADQVCPAFAGNLHRHHWPFDDPAKAVGTPEDQLRAFRAIRDQIRAVFEAYAAGRKHGLRASQGVTP